MGNAICLCGFENCRTCRKNTRTCICTCTCRWWLFRTWSCPTLFSLHVHVYNSSCVCVLCYMPEKSYFRNPSSQTCRLSRRDYSNAVGSNHYSAGGPTGVRKDILSPVPEMSYSGARVVDVTFGPPMSPSSVLSSTVINQGGAPRSGFSGRNWPSMGASEARSMDALHHTPPRPRREAPPYR